ncbi:MAG TPA: DUF3857 domain-containing protein [Polyangia bacterium]|nr:DUF3857 domain-containing protein [Polyangia bacterium]
MFIRRARGARVRALGISSLLFALASAPVAAAGAERAGEDAASTRGNSSADPFEGLVAAERRALAAAAGRVEAIGPLLSLMDLAEVGAPGRLDETFQALVADPRTDPLVGARAREWLARRAEADGDAAAAARWRAPLGMLSRVWVVGPFGDGRGSFGVAFPPETETAPPDPAQRYAGKEREVGWRRAEGAFYAGSLHLDALLRPHTEAAAYLVAYVRVSRASVAALRLGTPGPVKVWCNGRPVFAADRARSSRMDQDAVAIPLRAGWNRLLVKTVVGDGSWDVRARLTALDGRALAFDDGWLPEAASASTGAPSPVKALPPPRNLEALLREQVGHGKAQGTDPIAARGWLNLARYLAGVDSADRDERAAARAFETSFARQPTVAALMGLASVARDDDERRRALERARTLAATPLERARVLAALGDVARDQRRDAIAGGAWRAALEVLPSYWPAELSLASEEQSAGLPAAALARLDAMPAGVRAIPVVTRQRARVLEALERRDEAERALRTLVPHARDDADLWRELGAFAWDRGRREEALAAVATAARLRPELPSLTVDWARQLEGEGKLAEARAVLEDATRRLPDDFSLPAELGRLLDRHGEAAAALTWLRRGLALRPQDVELRRYTDAARARSSRRALAGDDDANSSADFAKAHAASVPTLLAAEAARAPAVPGAGAAAEPDPSVVLLDRHVVRVHPNGLAETFTQRVTMIRTEAGARDNKQFLVRYTPGVEDVEICQARVFRRDAAGAWQTLEASGRDDQDLSEPWYGLYYDFRAEVVEFDGLRAGDVVDLEYVVSDVSRENQMAGYFGDLQFVAEGVPKRRWDYTLLGPPGRKFFFARPNVARLTESVTEQGGGQVLRFAVTDVPRIETEPAMPGLAEISPYLHVSTYATWEEVGAWYWRLVEEQLVADENIRKAVAEAVRPVGGKPLTDLEKVRALHALVVGGTRYVGLEFGIHGFKPYKVSQVLSRRFGDCKDKAALLVVMLREAGIDAEMVLLRTRRGGRLATMPASLAIFDHAIAFVPKLGLYLDGTAEFSGMDELPGQDQGVMVLRVGPRGAHLAETPVLPSARNRAARHWSVVLQPDGTADVNETLTLTGQAAPEWREHYQTPGERSDRYGKAFSTRNPGTRLLSVTMPNIENRNRPVTVVAHATVPSLGERTAGDGLRLGLGTREVDLARTYARLSERRAALVLAYPWQHEEQIVYKLPVGFEPTHLPAARQIVSPFGRFTLQVEKQGVATIRVTQTLDVERDRVTPAEYPAFRRFLADVDATMAERITAAPVLAGAARSGGNGKGGTAP